MTRVRENVYVIGAGFSTAIGYPLARNLMVDTWPRLTPKLRVQLSKIIRFHYPTFDSNNTTSFPNIESLLTKISINEELFEFSRPAEGRFTRAQLVSAKAELITAIAKWFHEILDDLEILPTWLESFRERVINESAAIISFNWDLLLDVLLFDELNSSSYALGLVFPPKQHFLLKPHGSLNWYLNDSIKSISPNSKRTIFSHKDPKESVDAFLFTRTINSSRNRYEPLIIPPAFIKDFRKECFRRIWRRATDCVSTAKNIYFLGYSLPPEDLQAQFILRCGFHNQIEGRPKFDGTRYAPTGPANVVIVNPDQEAAKRIATVANMKCAWISKPIHEWV